VAEAGLTYEGIGRSYVRHGVEVRA